MINKTSILLATTLLTALISAPVLAGQAPIDEYSAATIFGTADSDRVNYSINSSSPISAALDAELFPTDQANDINVGSERVNYSLDTSPVSESLDAELFPDGNR
jgi:hypothetical protein